MLIKREGSKGGREGREGERETGRDGWMDTGKTRAWLVPVAVGCTLPLQAAA